MITTKHEKEKILKPFFERHFQMNVVLASNVDTDLLGTFSGDVERKGTAVETAIQKARLGIEATGIPLGIANEGSFGPHPQIPLLNSDLEIIVLVDAERDLVIEEYVVSASSNVGELKVSNLASAEAFLKRSFFGTHGMVVRPNTSKSKEAIKKGIIDRDQLAQAISESAARSADGLAHLETDMRAHFNPTRQKVIAEAAEKFVKRVGYLCPNCGAPGWGVVDSIMGLPCEGCGGPTALVHKEIEGCVKCRFVKVLPRSDGKEKAGAHLCPECNP